MPANSRLITDEDVFEAFQSEIVIAEYQDERTTRRKLIYDLFAAEYELFIGEELVWRGVERRAAVRQYNEFDAGKIDYTRENLAHAGI